MLPQGPSLSPRCLPSWLAVEQMAKRFSIKTTKKQTMSYTYCNVDQKVMFKSTEILHGLNMKGFPCSFLFYFTDSYIHCPQ